ncbi:MAG: peptidoglycan-binding protein [Cyanobacteria bacterium RYN_339]|nr:peptidoglycan-binding protein [Cyanobacteria bacterium RYN_339]
MTTINNNPTPFPTPISRPTVTHEVADSTRVNHPAIDLKVHTDQQALAHTSGVHEGIDLKAPPKQAPGVQLVKEGAKGDQVKELQQQLKAVDPQLTADGKFGPKTKAALEKYQQAHHLKVDGISGSETQSSLTIEQDLQTARGLIAAPTLPGQAKQTAAAFQSLVADAQAHLQYLNPAARAEAAKGIEQLKQTAQQTHPGLVENCDHPPAPPAPAPVDPHKLAQEIDAVNKMDKDELERRTKAGDLDKAPPEVMKAAITRLTDTNAKGRVEAASHLMAKLLAANPTPQQATELVNLVGHDWTGSWKGLAIKDMLDELGPEGSGKLGTATIEALQQGPHEGNLKDGIKDKDVDRALEAAHTTAALRETMKPHASEGQQVAALQNVDGNSLRDQGAYLQTLTPGAQLEAIRRMAGERADGHKDNLETVNQLAIGLLQKDPSAENVQRVLEAVGPRYRERAIGNLWTKMPDDLRAKLDGPALQYMSDEIDQHYVDNDLMMSAIKQSLEGSHRQLANTVTFN